MIENARGGGQRVGVAMELEKEEYNEHSEERGRCRDGETEAASKSKTSLGLPRQGIVEGRKEVTAQGSAVVPVHVTLCTQRGHPSPHFYRHHLLSLPLLPPLSSYRMIVLLLPNNSMWN
jgi:hypothetical protein